jgi:hypothetical protein
MQDDLFTTRVLTTVDDAWSAAIADLDASGTPVPLPSRPEWIRCIGGGSQVLVTADDRKGRCRAALALEIEPTRTLPGHLLARAHRLGTSLVGYAGEAVLSRLQKFAASKPRLLRVNLEFDLRTPEEHVRIAGMLRRLGFTPATTPRFYRQTLMIDLTRSEEALLESFSSTTRYELRHWSRLPVEIRPIRELDLADRLDDISRETMARTNGPYMPHDWKQRITLSNQLPDRSRLTGMFRAGRRDPDALLAYAWACSHGDHAHYDDAGSTRMHDLKIPMMSPLLWDLILWAKSGGCKWFDLGGTLAESATEEDSRLGIEKFKRRFSKVVVTVGNEWVLVPHPRRARLAARLHAVGSGLFRYSSRPS